LLVVKLTKRDEPSGLYGSGIALMRFSPSMPRWQARKMRSPAMSAISW
jgi:hypothetical protein